MMLNWLAFSIFGVFNMLLFVAMVVSGEDPQRSSFVFHAGLISVGFATIIYKLDELLKK